MIPPSMGRPYLKAPVDFIMDFLEIIQADTYTWLLEGLTLFYSTVLYGILIALVGLVVYHTYSNPATWKLFGKNILIFRDLIVSKLPTAVTSWLPKSITG